MMGKYYLTIKPFLDYMGVSCTLLRMNELDYNPHYRIFNNNLDYM